MTVKILRGDCRAVLKTLPDASVNCCISSPPYWGLRSYLPPGHRDKGLEIGSEATVQDWVATMVDVMREVRRVLRDDGLVFLNLGDSYAGSRRGPDTNSTLQGSRHNQAKSREATVMTISPRRDRHLVPRSDVTVPGLKEKDLIGQPWRLAFALQDDGWWLRQELIWHKRNPMPESAPDRFTKAHEHVFMLAKSGKPTIWRARDTREWSFAPNHKERVPAPLPDQPERTANRWRGMDYYFDLDAVQQPASDQTHARRVANGGLMPAGWATGPDHTAAGHQHAATHRKAAVPGNKTHHGADLYADGDEHRRTKGGLVKYAERARDRASATERMGRPPGWRKLATADSGIKQNDSFEAAMSQMRETRNPRDVFAEDEDEFAQFLRWKAEQQLAPDVLSLVSEPFKGAHFATFPPALIEPLMLAGCPEWGTVLDPFGGSGTTGLVADRNHRHAILIDIDERNVPMATARVTEDSPLFSQVSIG